MDRKQALDQLRVMQAWHEDNGNGPNADYDAICYAIGVIEAQPEQLGTNLAEVGTDTISRQQAIDEIDEWIKAFRENGHKESAADACLIQDGIIHLPPAQPKQRTGKCMWCERLKERNLRIEYYWIDEEGCTASFSEPHVVATGIAKFCPHCGAKMEGDAE